MTKNITKKLTNFLTENTIWYRSDVFMEYESYFKTGGNVNFYLLPKTLDELVKLISFLNKENQLYKLVGLTSNVMFLDNVDYTVIISTKNLTKVVSGGSEVEVECGYSLEDFVRLMVKESVTGYEGLEGIPGSIGGGIFMNAGAYGYDIGKNVNSVKYLDKTGKVSFLSQKKCEFSYRNSIFKVRADWVILSVKFKKNKGILREIERKIEVFHIARHTYQDFVYPTMGSLYSFNGDIYAKILTKNKKYRILYFLLKVILKNPIAKFLTRKKPNNNIFNALIRKFAGGFSHRISNKGINILVNDGQSSVECMLKHIEEIGNLLGNSVKVENEILIEPVTIKSNEYKKLVKIVSSINENGKCK